DGHNPPGPGPGRTAGAADHRLPDAVDLAAVHSARAPAAVPVVRPAALPAVRALHAGRQHRVRGGAAGDRPGGGGAVVLGVERGAAAGDVLRSAAVAVIPGATRPVKGVVMVDYTAFSGLRLRNLFPRELLDSFPLYSEVRPDGRGYDVEYLGGQWDTEEIDG